MKHFNFKINWPFCLSMGSIIIAMWMLLYFGYLLLYPFKPAEFTNVPFPVENKIVHPGETIRYYVEYHKLMDVPAKARHMLVNHVQINFSDIDSFLPVGDYELINHDITLPLSCPTGKAYLSIIFTYKINPLREIVITTRTEEFEIIPK